MQPIGIGLPTQPGITTPTQPNRDSGAERGSEPTQQIEATESVVQPLDAKGWQQWVGERDALQSDSPGDHPGLARYRDVADDGTRQQLQSLVGVDLYI